MWWKPLRSACIGIILIIQLIGVVKSAEFIDDINDSNSSINLPSAPKAPAAEILPIKTNNGSLHKIDTAPTKKTRGFFTRLTNKLVSSLVGDQGSSYYPGTGQSSYNYPTRPASPNSYGNRPSNNQYSNSNNQYSGNNQYGNNQYSSNNQYTSQSSYGGQQSGSGYSNGQCGRPSVEPVVRSQNARIVNGYEAAAHSWPWQVMLHIGTQLCGGSLISADVVVTAAHCFNSRNRVEAKVYVGAHHLFGEGDYGSQMIMARGLVHPDYDTGNQANDIALLKLQRPVQLNNQIQPVCLPPVGQDPPPGAECVITGWGRILSADDPNYSAAKHLPKTLQQATVPIAHQQSCVNALNPKQVLNMMMCAGGGIVDSCQGDSGGPLVCKAGGKWVLYGVTSWGISCGKAGYPGVYTRVSRFVPWINQLMSS